MFSILKGWEMIILGEGIDLFSIPLPSALGGKTLAESAIGARTGLNVIAVQQNGEIITSPPATTRLMPGAELLMSAMPNNAGKTSSARGLRYPFFRYRKYVPDAVRDCPARRARLYP